MADANQIKASVPDARAVSILAKNIYREVRSGGFSERDVMALAGELLSLVASVAGSLMSEPVDDETLKSFYRSVRPWGFWKPVHEMVVREDPSFQPNTDAGRDFMNIGVGTAWQLTLVTIPLYAIFRDLRGTLISLAVLVVTSIFLKKSWYDPLGREESVAAPADGALVTPPQTAD